MRVKQKLNNGMTEHTLLLLNPLLFIRRVDITKVLTPYIFIKEEGTLDFKAHGFAFKVNLVSRIMEIGM